MVLNFGSTIPYDIEKQRSTYPQEVLDEIVGLWREYQHYYSLDGVYTVDFAPLTYSDAPTLQVDEMAAIVLSESGQNSYADIKNCTEIWGQELDASHAADSCVQTDGTYAVHIDDAFNVLEDGMTISVVPDTDSVASQRMKVQGTPMYPMYIQHGDGTFSLLPQGRMLANVSYVVEYTEQRFVLQGESQIHVMAMRVILFRLHWQ